jgi:RimJ/RimL family protein N-acetyltransferase
MDEPGWSEHAPDGDWIWSEDRVREALVQEEGEVLFVSGCATNQVRFYPQFDAIVLFSAPAEVLIERLATRTNNPYGKCPDELAEVLGYLETVEPRPERKRLMETTITTARGEVVLRPSRREDATAYRDLRLDALQRSSAAFGADYESSAARPLSFWEERMAQGALGEQGVTYLALAGDRLIGMTSLVRNNLAKTQHSASIFGVYVSPDWRGSGVVDALVAACLAHGHALGLRVVRLGVVTTNASAIRLYLRHGFAVYGVERDALFVDGVYHDELMMECRLGDTVIVTP